MRKFLSRGLEFVRTNPTIISSLLLIVVVVCALFLNSYWTLNNFQQNLDKTLRTKALVAENVFAVAAQSNFSALDEQQSQNLQHMLETIRKNNDEISEITIFAPEAVGGQVIATAKNPNVQTSQDPSAQQIAAKARNFALSVDDAFAYVDSSGGSRYWNVVKAVRNQEGVIKGVLLLKLSLAANDALSQQAIMQAYAFSLVAVIIVLLLVLNHARLFSFEIKAKKLEEIDKMKDDFISMASHELRSPLTAIKGYGELLKDMAAKDANPEQEKYLENINVSAERLENLVEDLLVVSRIQQNQLPISCTELDVEQVIKEITAQMQVMADQKKLQLENLAINVPHVFADGERVKQILVNLLNNAIKYTPEGKVEIKTHEDPGMLYITVADTGLGISAEHMQHLFSKFYRVKTAQTSNISGTGLGLWIAKEIAQKMGGDITAESIEGVGSHFTLKLKKV